MSGSLPGLDLLDAAYNLVHDYPGGALSLAPRVGMNATTLSHEVNGTGTAKLGLLTAEKLTDRTGDDRILMAWAAKRGYRIIKVHEPLLDGAGEVLARLSETSREFGELCSEICRDVGDDGQINDNERRRIEREALQLMGALARLTQAVAANNESTHKKQGGA